MTDAVKKAIEALTLARPIVESDYHEAKEHCDADWEGISKTALDAIDAALEQAGEPVAGIGHGEEADYAELKRLYNFSDDDSAQFTRWNMLAAIRHGKRVGQEFDAGEGRCGDNGLALCQACSLPAHELTQSPGCGAPMQKPSALAFNDEKVEATQADRDMAADVLFHVDDDPFVDNIREGWEDDSYLVQAFARHRASHSATAKLQDRIDELTNEAEIFDEDHADQNRMVDRIADLIGLPQDQELDTVAFELWISAQTAATAAKDAEIDIQRKEIIELKRRLSEKD